MSPQNGDAALGTPRTPMPAQVPFSARSGQLSARSGQLSARSGQIPFLPGNSVGDYKLHQRKGQTLTYGPGGATDKARPLDSLGNGEAVPKLDFGVLRTLADPFHRYDQSGRAITHEEREELRESARNTYRPAIQPSWLKHDRQVLKFNAYFQESVTENPKENFRIRKCVVFYYMEDGTMMITEPKELNSGIPQGTFVKRHRLPRPKELGGGYYTHEDLKCSSNLVVYSRVFRLTDCDEFTQTFYREVCGEQQGGEELPMDSFRAAQTEPDAELSPRRRRDIAEGREYNETFLGGARKNKALAQFLENDRKVLNFKCFWDDPTRYGSRLYYTTYFYLADDTVEIHENLARNSGRDPYPIFWRRAVLRKNPHINPVPGMMEPEPIPYQPQDFIVGNFFEVYGRQIYIYDCDEFTRDFYRQYMRLEQDHQEVRQPNLLHTALRPPPHSGFGAEEDSLANVKRLEPRPPRRDVNKMLTESDTVLRFEARMVSGVADNDTRKFIVALFPADDSVSVWEVRQRNSGHTEGRIVRRARIQNPATNAWFKPADFVVGTTLEINAVPYHLQRADEATMRYMEEHCANFPASDNSRLLAHLRGLRQGLDGLGVVGLEEFRELAQSRLGLDLLPHDLMVLSRSFGVSEESIDCQRLSERLLTLGS